MVVRRIGILGGTFDPFHHGHLAAAVNARHSAHLDVVLLVVAHDPWQKSDRRIVTPAADRLDLVRAGVEGVPGVEASDIEIARGGPSYTADTLDQLAHSEPEAELFVVVGADLAAELDSWVRVADIQKRAGLVVLSRPGHEVPDLPGWSVTSVAIPPLDISSTDLRRWSAAGAPLDGLTPPAVMRLIAERGLYAGGR